MKKPSKLEQEVLAIVLKELRRAIRDKRPLELMIDPWVMGGGLYLNAARSEAGHSYTIEGVT